MITRFLLAALALAALLAPAGPAAAATGTLIIDQTRYEDPSGCIPVQGTPPPKPVAVDNRTDEAALVFVFPGCRGPLAGRPLSPGDAARFRQAGSVFVR
ncbi:hypothetical protein AGRA3207_000334 [Actinomadura graeca]|uniref:Uncharacterized protein n=1 Tax=Actinomadura graeca TaxID=2750812 RepID=A0ABX8QM29_9ACTN|nr:hypothetical protein [Actinomadura graeca]QXJ19750.1 hypothetical protein AGRA3207_000334 [Actinomadura graeca]